MEATAFALRKEYEDNFDGGVLAVDGADFDVAAELERGGGVIVVDAMNAALTYRLRIYPFLKELASVPEGADPYNPYAHQSKTALVELAQRRGIDKATSLNKQDLAGALLAQDVAVSSGDQAAADTPQPPAEEQTEAPVTEQPTGEKPDTPAGTPPAESQGTGGDR